MKLQSAQENNKVKLDPEIVKMLRVIAGFLGSMSALVAYVYWDKYLAPWPF